MVDWVDGERRRRALILYDARSVFSYGLKVDGFVVFCCCGFSVFERFFRWLMSNYASLQWAEMFSIIIFNHHLTTHWPRAIFFSLLFCVVLFSNSIVIDSNSGRFEIDSVFCLYCLTSSLANEQRVGIEWGIFSRLWGDKVFFKNLDLSFFILILSSPL